MEQERTRDQMQQMEMQIKELQNRLGGNFSAPPNSIPYNGQTYTNGHESEASRTLPPINGHSAMQGVQYGENGR